MTQLWFVDFDLKVSVIVLFSSSWTEIFWCHWCLLRSRLHSTRCVTKPYSAVATMTYHYYHLASFPGSPCAQMMKSYCKWWKAGRGLGMRLTIIWDSERDVLLGEVWANVMRGMATVMGSGGSLVPRPLPDFISQLWRNSCKIKSESGLGTRFVRRVIRR